MFNFMVPEIEVAMVFSLEELKLLCEVLSNIAQKVFINAMVLITRFVNIIQVI